MSFSRRGGGGRVQEGEELRKREEDFKEKTNQRRAKILT
jgi:hypothetical protein